MAYDFNEMNHRSRDRDMARQRRIIIQRQQRILRWTIFGLIAAVIVLMLVVLLSRRGKEEAATPGTPGTTATTQTTATSTPPPTTSTAPTEPETIIHLVFGGDVNVTDKLVAAGENSGKLDYTQVLMDVAPILAGADATFLNLEGGLYGPAYGSATASAPEALVQAMAAAGVDMIQLANSRTISNGLTGLSNTIHTLRANGIQPLGVFASDAEREESQGFTLVNIGGIRVAIVAFTKGMDGMSLPAGSESCVNLLYTDYATTYQNVDTKGITRVLEAAQAQNPDVTIAMVHWGSEYNDTISPTQEQIITLMQGLGVDAIVGTHSHFVQQVNYDAAAGTVVAYSLGDLLGDGEKAGTNYSILLDLEITRDNITGQTRITGCDYTGVYLLTPEKDNMPLQLVRIQPAMEMYEHNHIQKVTESAYENMRYAWQRILERTKG